MADQVPQIATTHYEYQRNSLRWKMQMDFYRGGINVIDPDGTSSRQVWFLEPREADEGQLGTDPTPGAAKTRFQWVPVKTNSYLLSHEREPYGRWNDRNARLYHIPIVRPIVDIVINGLLRNAPKRCDDDDTMQLDDLWTSYFNDTDLSGSSMDRIVRTAATIAGLTGKCFALTDRQRDVPGVLSADDQVKSGIRAYTYLINPLDIIDWALDSNGNFSWVKIQEAMEDGRDPITGGSKEDDKIQYKIWTKKDWQVWQEQPTNDAGKQWVKTSEGPNPIGRVPLRVLHCKKALASRQTMESEGLCNDLVDIDRTVLNKCSLLEEIDHGQTFSQLFVPYSRGLGLSPIEIGMYTAVGYDAEAGKPMYLAPDPLVAEGLQHRIEKLIELAKMMSPVSRGQSEMSQEARSGVAMYTESEERFNTMSAFVDQLEAFERGIYKDFADWEDVPKDSIPKCEYKRNFHFQSLETEISNALAIAKLQVGNKAMAPLSKAIMTKQMKEMGIGEDIIAEAMKAVEEQIVKAEKQLEEAQKMQQAGNKAPNTNYPELGRSSTDELSSKIQPK